MKFSYVECFLSRFWIIASLKRKSSSSEVFYKIGVLKNFAKFTEKQICRKSLSQLSSSLETPTEVFFCKLKKGEHLQMTTSEN